MSWNKSYSSLDEFRNNRPSHESPDANEEQVAAARAAAEGAIASGAFGHASKDFVVYLSGHANPDHEPRSGWANDCLSISITQKN